MAAVTRRQYKGAAAQTTIVNALASGDTSATLAATTGWPSGAEPFFVVISPGTSSEEKCSATISGSVLTLTRAQDDTTAQSHASGAAIYPVFTADDADEANKLASTLTTRGDLLTMDSGPDFVRLAVGSKGGVVVSDGSDPSYLSVGANGQVLVADSGVSKGVAWVDPLSNRNVVINGAMQVAQRGTSATGLDNTNSAYHTVDLFRLGNVGPLGTWTQSVENDAPTGSGFRKSLKMLCTTADASPAAGDIQIISHRFEGQNVQRFLKGTASAKQFALSFWVKANVTGTYICELQDNDNTRSVSASYTVSASATWEKKTIIFPADTTGAFDNDNALSLQVNFYLGAGSDRTSGTLATTWASTTTANRAVGQTNLGAATDNYWQITGVQLEAGSVATPFEFEDFGVTLAKCRRYYQRGLATNGVGNSASVLLCTWSLPVAMRVIPTLSQSANLNMSDGTSDKVTSSPSVTGLDGNSNMLVATVGNFSGLTANRPYMGPRYTSTDGEFIFSAEL
jgi:hypothetical protein